MPASRAYAALLRGINVGGKNAVPMADLRAICSSLDHEDVQTYLQSGNVVLRSDGSSTSIAGDIEREIEKQLGLKLAVVVRTHTELESVVAGRSFDEPDPKKLHVLFLKEQPNLTAVSSLDPEWSPGDEFAVSGLEIYLHYPSGSGRTKLTLDYFERKLGVAGTARNWNTVVKLAELTGG